MSGEPAKAAEEIEAVRERLGQLNTKAYYLLVALTIRWFKVVALSLALAFTLYWVGCVAGKGESRASAPQGSTPVGTHTADTDRGH